ncbi:MAG: outer membrane lipoprotein carrier protein LolA [Flavobacteriaceae bacterium]|nr:outer membrane lipoprotein carrier protein LolA [Flavobacteriaceae bacterium]
MMMLFKKFNYKQIFLLFLNLFAINTFGQNSKLSLELLNKVSNNLNSFENINFEFRYKLENKTENISQEINGNATISKNLYSINFLGITQLFDGNKLYTIIPENQEINISFPGEEELDLNINKMFEIYRKGYLFEWDIEQKVEGFTIQYIKLTPKSENDNIKHILLGLNINNFNLYRIIEVGFTNTLTTLTILNQKENLKLKKDFFEFNKESYPNYYINE